MLAYVFWHWRAAAAAASDYEERLRRFHAVFAAGRPAGFVRSAAYGVTGVTDAAWLPPGIAAYEDWYLLENSAALDAINEAAVSGARREPHDAAASRAAGGTAGLYRLRAGDPAIETQRVAIWLAKPAGMSYDAFYGALAPLTARPGVALWGRQMTLGPTPEFSLRSPHRLELPAEITAAAATSLDRLWPPARPPEPRM